MGVPSASFIGGSLLCGQIWPSGIDLFWRLSPALQTLVCPCPFIAELSVFSANSVGCCCLGTFNISSSLRLGSLGSFLVLQCWDGYGRAGLEKPFHRKRKASMALSFQTRVAIDPSTA
jgi:hypothetical protein